ncbi:MAG: transketolase, partial [Elusimicrobia bacterium]|nr:transketolase [Elusimicrobiota bacterium]
KYSVFAILGDGEMQEGSIWEALMAGGHYRVGNLCGILDYNKIQENGPVSEILALEPLAEKLRTFNWEVVEADGHNFTDLKRAFDCFPTVSGKPLFIIAHTVKGKGISFMENNPAWHGKAPGEKDLKVALDELV